MTLNTQHANQFSQFVKLFVALVFGMLVTGCGFKPLYGDGFGGASGEYAAIEVAPIPDRLGQLVRSRLTERFGTTAEPLYRLDITLETETFQFGLRGDNPDTGAIGDAAATQEQVTVIARYNLIDQASDENIFKDEISVRSSFDLVLSDFAIIAQREDTSRRLALEAVDRIERRLALFFSQKKAKEQPDETDTKAGEW